MAAKQKTIKQECSISGVGLHTGNKTKIVLKSAPAGTGIEFIRTDLPDRPVIKVSIDNILTDDSVSRCSSIGKGPERIYTIEHLMSVLSGLGIDNLRVEINGNELPGLDGSGLEYLNLISKAGTIEQDKERYVFQIQEPIGISRNDAAIYIAPAADFKISYALDYNHPHLRSQFYSTVVTEEIFKTEIAPCRTFCLEREIAQLSSAGLGKGANFKNTLVVGDSGVIDNKLRFSDEFVRHKILDIIGDIYLLGIPVQGHIFAVKSGHRLNMALLKKIHEQKLKYDKRFEIVKQNWPDKKQLSVEDIMNVLPHRYPFLLVDRVIEVEQGKRGIGIKNVTINDNFFQGHFPSKPVMPGVMMIEAMAQTAGIVLLTNEAHRGKLALFMSADNIKFRKVVQPGDQLLLDVEVVNEKSRLAKIHAQAKVGEDIVAEADMILSFTEASFLD